MSLISEIRRKSKLVDAPELTITKEDQDRLNKGEVVVIKDNQTHESYMIRIKIDKIGSGSISKDDLEIEKIKLATMVLLRLNTCYLVTDLAATSEKKK